MHTSGGSICICTGFYLFYIYICVCVFVCVFMHTCLYICIFSLPAHSSVSRYICIYIYAYICIYAYVCVYSMQVTKKPIGLAMNIFHQLSGLYGATGAGNLSSMNRERPCSKDSFKFVFTCFFLWKPVKFSYVNKFAYPRPTCSHQRTVKVCAFRRLMCKDQRIQKKQLCGWKTNLWPCLFLLNRVVNTGGTSLTGQLWMKWVVESGVRSNSGAWWGRWISRHTFPPKNMWRSVLRYSTLLILCAHVAQMWDLWSV